MEQSDKTEFLGVLKVMKDVYGGGEMTKEAKQVYWLALGGLSIEAYRQATSNLIKTSKWFPKPSEILAAAGISEESQVAEAWGQLKRAINGYGSAHAIYFSDPRLSATVESLGGLRSLAMRQTSDVDTFLWHRFKEIYPVVQPEKQKLYPTSRQIAIVDGEPIGQPLVKVIGSDGDQYQRIDHKRLAASRKRGLTDMRSAVEQVAGQKRIE